MTQGGTEQCEAEYRRDRCKAFGEVAPEGRIGSSVSILLLNCGQQLLSERGRNCRKDV